MVAGNTEAVTYTHQPNSHTLPPSPSSTTLGAEATLPQIRRLGVLTYGPAYPKHSRSTHFRPSRFFPACHAVPATCQTLPPRQVSTSPNPRLHYPDLTLCLVCLHTRQGQSRDGGSREVPARFTPLIRIRQQPNQPGFTEPLPPASEQDHRVLSGPTVACLPRSSPSRAPQPPHHTGTQQALSCHPNKSPGIQQVVNSITCHPYVKTRPGHCRCWYILIRAEPAHPRVIRATRRSNRPASDCRCLLARRSEVTGTQSNQGRQTSTGSGPAPEPALTTSTPWTAWPPGQSIRGRSLSCLFVGRKGD